MDLLWKKNASGLYTNIFANVDKRSFEVLPGISQNEYNSRLAFEENKKNNAKSTQLRQLGNEKIKECDWREAMTYYNRSLCHAEINTQNVCLAYANRSTCFLKLKMYDKCLIDIEMAINANYPEEKKSKLEDRRALCLKQMEKALPTKMGAPELDFKADHNFPGMANVVQMQYSDKFGRHFVAKRDIEVGKVVMVDEAFVTSTIMRLKSNNCDICFKNSANFIACANCTSALFCGQNCAEDFTHRSKCGRICSKPDDFIEFVLKSVIQMLPHFDEIEDLMKFVTGVVEDKNMKEVPHSTVDMESKYRMFLKLNLWLSKADHTRLIGRGYEVNDILMQMPEIKETFDTTAKKRFLMHLCVQHTYIVLCNSFQSNVMGGISLLKNHFNHSCAPNVLCSVYENKAICTTSRRIKKGDQLFISYGQYWFGSRHQRQKQLYDDFGFHCECEKCQNKHWPISSMTVKSDPQFRYLVAQLHGKTDFSKMEHLKPKCLDILIKYADSAWCKELDMVSDWYQQCSVETMY